MKPWEFDWDSSGFVSGFHWIYASAASKAKPSPTPAADEYKRYKPVLINPSPTPANHWKRLEIKSLTLTPT